MHRTHSTKQAAWMRGLALFAAAISMTFWLPALAASPATQIADINMQQTNPAPNDSSTPQHLRAIGSTLYFGAATGAHGRELWKTDGTTVGTAAVKNISPGAANFAPTELTDVNGTLFFAATEGISNTELWKSDGTSGGTVIVKDINPVLHSQ